MEKVSKCLASKVDKNSPVPIYYQIYKEIKGLIEKGELKPFDKISGDLELSKILNIHTKTVRKAYEELKKEGLIKRIKKQGTFITEKARKISHSIGFFYFSEAEEVMIKRAEHMQRYLSVYGYDLKIFPFEYDFYKKTDLNKFVEEKNLTGGIFVVLNYKECFDNFIKLEEKKFPHVRLGNPYFMDKLKYPLVCGNERKKMEFVLNYLKRLGHRKIGLVACYRNSVAMEEYFKFYNRKDFKEKWFISLEFSGPKEKYKRMPFFHIARGYIEKNKELTAVMVEYQLFSLDLLREANNIGIKVPEELSIISLRDTDELEYVFPSITAMRLQDKKEVEKSCEVLLKILKKDWDFKEKVILVDYELIERDSVRQMQGKTGKEVLVYGGWNK